MKVSNILDKMLNRKTTREYFGDGRLKKEYQINNKKLKDGFYREWFFNGKKQEESFFRNGIPDHRNKTFKTWYENGVLMQKIFYKKPGTRLSFAWSKEGILRHVIQTKNGKILIEWYHDIPESKGNSELFSQALVHLSKDSQFAIRN